MERKTFASFVRARSWPGRTIPGRGDIPTTETLPLATMRSMSSWTAALSGAPGPQAVTQP